MAKAEPDPEIQQLLAASDGLNIALDFLPGSLPYSIAMRHLVEPEMAAMVVWLDALTTNIDRTPRNPNLLIWHKQLWLIDHGASLYLQHSWTDIENRAKTPFPQIADHVLLPIAGSIIEAGVICRQVVTQEPIESIVESIPDEWLSGCSPFASSSELRQAYVNLLIARLAAADAFEHAAESARIAVQS